MPVETLRPSDGRLAGVPFTSAMPFRILNKGPDYFRRPAEPGARKLSAVERLEADKAKYVKSQQVVLTRQEPVKPPIIRKPLLSTGMMLQSRINAPPARKVPRRPADSENGGGTRGAGWRRGPPLNLDILNNLINNVCDGPLHFSPSPVPSSPSASSPSSGGNSIGNGLSADQERSNRVLNNLKHVNNCNTSSSSSSSTASPFNNNSQASPAEPSRRPPPVPARGIRMGVPVPYSTPNSVTVRRVDVRPQAEVRKPQRTQLQPQIKPRQTAQPQVAQPQAPPPPSPQQPQTQPLPLTPTQALPSPPPYLPPSPMVFRAGIMPPASPAFTRLSSVSSRGSRPGSARKHPSLHRSKSDLSDRYSRATADLERFFNYCGLHPEEVEGMGGVERFARASSDIVSVSKLRSVSTPSSECERAREQGEDEDEEGPAQPGERVPYGISVIERNARVIKWLYGIRQARDSNAVSNV
ncbi:protein FAM110B [Coregonus clupeaformis]|uniref:protein FAM110B n=1 Tax=Coregonus clupeaformis TaxID=59861 RepID=UPI001E1C3AF0|nr:protein FAM110B [Coregonus clupeaformis]XP_045062810.1 protein FAM110B [Coregonus clupeaformis]